MKPHQRAGNAGWGCENGVLQDSPLPVTIINIRDHQLIKKELCYKVHGWLSLFYAVVGCMQHNMMGACDRENLLAPDSKMRKRLQSCDPL